MCKAFWARILLVDGDADFNALAKSELGRLGFNIEFAMNIAQAEMKLRANHFHLILLNVSIKGCCGLQFARLMEEQHRSVPTIFLLDRSERNCRLEALAIGDDVMRKPLALNELAARIWSVLRRCWLNDHRGDIAINLLEENDFVFSGIHICPKSMTATTAIGQTEHLGRKELALTRLFSQHPGIILSHSDILRCVWGPGANRRSRSLEQYIVKIRKLLRSSNVGRIESVHGIGYRYVKNGEHLTVRTTQ
ncbi:MAG: response regulator transcription factor [Puniceicoccales bacterium]|nr:response regulator transcription factor [Puniceicoccales bacterium]